MKVEKRKTLWEKKFLTDNIFARGEKVNIIFFSD